MQKSSLAVAAKGIYQPQIKDRIMATMNSPRNAELVEQVLLHVDRRVESAERHQLTPFVEAFFSSSPNEEMRARDPQDVYATTYQLWQYIQNFDRLEPKIHFFNPDFEQHGWQSQRTVLAALVNDSPFIVDSIRIELNRRGIAVHTIHSSVLTVARNDDGDLQGVQTPAAQLQREGDRSIAREALVFMEVTRQSRPELLQELESELAFILAEVDSVVKDFVPMRDRALQVAAELLKCDGRPQCDADSLPVSHEQAAEFMRWLCADHFTFLGYQCYRVDENYAVNGIEEEAALGLLASHPELFSSDLLHEVTLRNVNLKLANGVLGFSKSAARSRVHRNAYPDYITLRLPNADEDGFTEHRFFGLYTSQAYHALPCSVPVWGQKVAAIEEASGLDLAGHDGKELRQIINTFPRDELIHSNISDLNRTVMGVWRIQERRKVRLFLRHDKFNKFVSAMVYTPRDMYNTRLRSKIESILWDAFGADDVDFTTYFCESTLTRTHFVFRVRPETTPDYQIDQLRRQISQAAEQWSDRLNAALLDELGEEQGTSLARIYENAFSAGFQDDFDPRSAIGDIRKIECLSKATPLQTRVYRVPEEAAQMLHFRLYHLGEPIALSDLLPPLENMGLRVCGDRTYKIRRLDGEQVWMHDFSLSYRLADSLVLDEVSAKFQEAFRRVWAGDAESDTFNKLILGTDLDWRGVALLRAYARYMKQIGFKFQDAYIAETLGKYLDLTNSLYELFVSRFDPAALPGEEEALEQDLAMQLENVEHLNEDSIFNQYIALIKATVRTNYFQLGDDGRSKSYFSFKLMPGRLPDVPAPVPMYEIFVYSPQVEGVHLRGGKVARGGLRWSDRTEDYRTEVLGLVKAQQVKNSVIVPVGAKGGFVAKKQRDDMERATVQAEGIAAYKVFISGLLDLSDNIVGERVEGPKLVVRHDDDDPYLVVAADKGTATFSDIANQLSLDYGFWLGDAFASGGSVGYDHKKMGITAKGAWVSVQRHFRERGIDVHQHSVSVIGIGDMGGDVFGNGMLLSDKLQLKAAFNHEHIFIDPNPDAARSFAERQRLFALPRGSWSDYEPSLISQGGGVFSRKAKSIPISPEMQAAFNIVHASLSPNDLIRCLLCAPLDLLWNGGIGTYVKGSSEIDADVGDKANDSLRVNACDLQCQVIGEGGNLGLTQLARVEFARAGGAVNTDFIDNSAGVDCSDHEVNIKILLQGLVDAGDMTEKQRRVLLESMTDDVSALVLCNNYKQAQAISVAEAEARMRFVEYRRLINRLEESGKLNRALEFLPSDEELLERDAQGGALTRPELSVLISYVKSELKEALLCGDICSNEYVGQVMDSAFPICLSERYPEALAKHRLRCEIIATQLANDMVNHMGITFVDRMRAMPGVEASDVALAYIFARDAFNVPHYWRLIEAIDLDIETCVQQQLMSELIRLVRRASHWFLHNQRGELDPAADLHQFQETVTAVHDQLHSLISGRLAERWENKRKELSEKSVPDELAEFIASAPNLYSALSITKASQASETAPSEVASAFFEVGEQLKLHWLHKQISDLPVHSQWQALARESYRDDLETQLVAITSSALEFVSENTDGGVAQWLEASGESIARWHQLIGEVRAANDSDHSVYTVANRALGDLVNSVKR